MRPEKEPVLIQGGLAVDDRGVLRFVNDFDFDGVKRFYQVENHQAGFVRAFHGHYDEGKYVYVASGAAIVVAIRLDAMFELDQNREPPEGIFEYRYVLSSQKPAVLWIPPYYANGFKTLEPKTKVMFFSTATLGESRGDDIRFRADLIDGIWDIEQR